METLRDRVPAGFPQTLSKKSRKDLGTENVGGIEMFVGQVPFKNEGLSVISA